MYREDREVEEMVSGREVRCRGEEMYREDREDEEWRFTERTEKRRRG